MIILPQIKGFVHENQKGESNMRCGCMVCGAYMAHSEKGKETCICAACGYECRICLGEGISLPPIKKNKDGGVELPDHLLDRYRDHEED